MRHSSSSVAETFPLDVQEAEENFDLALIASLEIDVLPHLGGPRIPDDLVSQLGKILERGSTLYELEEENSSRSSGRPHPPSISPSPSLSSSMPTSISSRAKASPPSLSQSPPSSVVRMDAGLSYADLGSTDFGNMVPRERFSFWCFDLLFLICSDVTKGSNLAYTCRNAV